MRKTVIRLICIMAAAVFALPAMAQTDDAKEEMLRRRAAQKVGQLGDYIQCMGRKLEDMTEAKQKEYKEYFRQSALGLFINNGDEYEEDGVMREGVLMEVTSASTNSSTKKLVKTYFAGLINMQYSQVTIETTDVANISVSKLQKVDEDLYVCTCYFEQKFCGYRDGNPVYRDITKKRVKCYVKTEQTEDGEEYIVLLGDVTATETIKL